MWFLGSFLVLIAAPGVLSKPLSVFERKSTDNVRVVWEHEKAGSKASLTLMSADKEKIYAQACDHSLGSGDFAKFPIAMDVNQNGFGNLIYGDKKHKIHSLPEQSGGISCSKIYDDQTAAVDCLVPWTGSFQLTALASNEALSCFPDDFDSGNDSELEKRQTIPVPVWIDQTRKVGNGNPHQNYFHKQITENLSCGAASTCSVGHSNIEAYSYGWSATVTPFEWISGGFSVSKTYSNGNDYSCGGESGETVCVWYKMAHTAYTVRNGKYSPNTGGFNAHGDPLIIFSPNTNNKGGGFYCVVGTCRSQGEGYWVKSGRAGGP